MIDHTNGHGYILLYDSNICKIYLLKYYKVWISQLIIFYFIDIKQQLIGD